MFDRFDIKGDKRSDIPRYVLVLAVIVSPVKTKNHAKLLILSFRRQINHY